MINKTYCDSNIKTSYITIWAEENGVVQAGQFCFGYGANGYLKGGYVNMVPGKIVRGSVIGVKRDKSYVVEEIAIDILLNGRIGNGLNGDKFKDSYGKIVKASGAGKGSIVLTTPIPITAGDIINFRNSNPVNGSSPTVVALLIQLG